MGSQRQGGKYKMGVAESSKGCLEKVTAERIVNYGQDQASEGAEDKLAFQAAGVKAEARDSTVCVQQEAGHWHSTTECEMLGQNNRLWIQAGAQCHHGSWSLSPGKTELLKCVKQVSTIYGQCTISWGLKSSVLP